MASQFLRLSEFRDYPIQGSTKTRMRKDCLAYATSSCNKVPYVPCACTKSLACRKNDVITRDASVKASDTWRAYGLIPALAAHDLKRSRSCLVPESPTKVGTPAPFPALTCKIVALPIPATQRSTFRNQNQLGEHVEHIPRPALIWQADCNLRQCI